MKKRLFGLALALVMVISLLPLTTLAEDPAPVKPRFDINDPNLSEEMTQAIEADKTYYVKFEDVTGGNKPVLVAQDAEAPTDNYMKFQFVDGVCKVTFHGVNYKPTAAHSGAFFEIAAAKDCSGAFPIELTLEGVNNISSEAASGIRFIFGNENNNTTITGNGSLNISMSYTKSTKLAMFQKKGGGDFIIKDTELNLTCSDSNTGLRMIISTGNIIIDHAKVTIAGNKGYALFSGGLSSASDDTNIGITIQKGSDVNIQYTNNVTVVQTAGRIEIASSNVEIRKSAQSVCFATSLPYLTGNYSSVQVLKVAGADPSMKDLSNYEVAEGTVLNSTDHKFSAYKVVHACVAASDDGDCTTEELCACGKVVAEVKTHIPGANADDCTKDTMCGNAGCTKVYEAHTATAHVKGEDDGDCTTPIMCTTPGCAQVAEAGAEKHTVTNRTDCSVAYNCEVCGKQAYAAGEHTPAADDGDCTTAVKCSICGKEAIAAKTHKYTDKNDTTCDNAGCTNTRKVEGTENPKTGDNTALVLMVSLMAVAAAAFVTTKKFAR